MKRILAAALLLLPLPAAAQSYPSKPIRMIVAFPAGGPTDLIARILAEPMGRQLGTTVVVDNRGGAGGGIGTAAAAKSPPDGYTIVLSTVSTQVLNLFLYKQVGYDPVKDFAPISHVVNIPNVMVLHPSAPGATLTEFMAYAKSKPGDLTFASGGNGTITQLSAEVFARQAGLDLRHIPYRGAGPALNATLAGEVTMMFDNLPTSLPHIRAGALKTFGVSTAARSPVAPDIPTVAESGLPGYATYTWNALFAPAGTPPAIIASLHQATMASLADEGVRRRLGEIGAEPVGTTPEALAKFLDQQLGEWGRLIKEIGLQPE